MPADTIILIRGGTAAEWETANPVLSFREMGLETDTRKLKVGDGITAWDSLNYYATNGVDGYDGTDGLNADVTRFSPTSNTIGTGSKTFAYATSSNLGWVFGTRLRAANSATNFVEGVVTAVSSTSVTIDVDTTVGSGTYTSWSLAVAGERGANGTNGVDGKTVHNGAGAPSGGLGVDGDFYIDTTADAIYGPKASGAWGSPTSLIGPAGAGAAGANADMTRSSTSTAAIGLGSVAFTYTATSSNLGWVVGMRLRASSSSTQYMEGPITAVSSSSVTIDVDNKSGSGSYTSWTIGVAGDKGIGAIANETAIGAAEYQRCTIANNATDANNDIDIGAGTEWVTNGTIWKPVSVAAITKRLDAAWAVGTNQGGLDTGSKANSTWYYIWVIHRSDTDVTDILFSTSATSPTMPSSFDYKRRLRIGAMLTNSSGGIRSGTWHIDSGRFTFASGIVDLDLSSLFVASVVVSAPPGFVWLGDYAYSDNNPGVLFFAFSSTGVSISRTQASTIIMIAQTTIPIRLTAGSVLSLSPQTVNTRHQSVSTRGFAE
jgi:hypothetical protein